MKGKGAVLRRFPLHRDKLSKSHIPVPRERHGQDLGTPKSQEGTIRAAAFRSTPCAWVPDSAAVVPLPG